MNYSVLSCFQWVRLDANILETMPKKMGGEKTVLGRVDKALEKQINVWL